MNIISIDQARACGFSYWKDNELNEYGVENFTKKDYSNYNVAINKIRHFLDELTNKYKPDLIAIEDIQYQRNQKVYKQLGNLQGVLIDYCIENDIPYEVVMPKKWKALFGIKGGRAKEKLGSVDYCKNKFNIDVTDDVADAVLIGYYIIKTYDKE